MLPVETALLEACAFADPFPEVKAEDLLELLAEPPFEKALELALEVALDDPPDGPEKGVAII